MKLNTVLVQASKISFFIVRFHKVSTYISFRMILTVLYNGTLVNNEVTSKLMNLYPSLNNSGGMVLICLAASCIQRVEDLLCHFHLYKNYKFAKNFKKHHNKFDIRHLLVLLSDHVPNVKN